MIERRPELGAVYKGSNSSLVPYRAENVIVGREVERAGLFVAGELVVVSIRVAAPPVKDIRADSIGAGRVDFKGIDLGPVRGGCVISSRAAMTIN